MRRIGRWLREPVRKMGEDWDWRDFGRSFGRFAGGYLDSGEADTHSYAQGKLARNTGKLAKGNEKNPHRLGVFRQMTDESKHDYLLHFWQQKIAGQEITA